MANDSDAIVIGANGKVSVAPVGTTLPTTVTGSLNAAFKETGYISEDGVTFTYSKSVDGVMVWQSLYAVRRVVTDRDFMIAMVMREWNKISVPLAFGGGTIVESPSGSGSYKYSPPNPEDVDERAVIVDWVDGTRHSRLVMPRGFASDNVESNITRGKAADLPITISLIAEDNALPWYMMFDDDVFA
jgi:hypothetical protein